MESDASVHRAAVSWNCRDDILRRLGVTESSRAPRNSSPTPNHFPLLSCNVKQSFHGTPHLSHLPTYTRREFRIRRQFPVASSRPAAWNFIRESPVLRPPPSCDILSPLPLDKFTWDEHFMDGDTGLGVLRLWWRQHSRPHYILWITNTRKNVHVVSRFIFTHRFTVPTTHFYPPPPPLSCGRNRFTPTALHLPRTQENRGKSVPMQPVSS